MGDPAGVGPEVCLDLLQDPEISELCTPIIFGDFSVLQTCAKQTSKPLQVGKISGDEIAGTIEHGVHDLGLIHVNDLVPGTANAQTGRATYEYVASAIDACLAGKVDAVVTCPANKEAMQAAGVTHPGHTEIFAERTKTCLLYTSPSPRDQRGSRMPSSA